MRNKLLKARREAKLTQQQIADLAGINRSYYAHIERAARRPSLIVAIKIAQVLGKRVEEIFLPSDVTFRHTTKTSKLTGTEGL